MKGRHQALFPKFANSCAFGNRPHRPLFISFDARFSGRPFKDAVVTGRCLFALSLAYHGAYSGPTDGVRETDAGVFSVLFLGLSGRLVSKSWWFDVVRCFDSCRLMTSMLQCDDSAADHVPRSCNSVMSCSMHLCLHYSSLLPYELTWKLKTNPWKRTIDETR